MLNSPGDVLGRVDLPKLLHSDAINLLFVVLVEIEMLHELFRELTSAALAENRALCMELHTTLKGVFRGSVFANADVISGNAFH